MNDAWNYMIILYSLYKRRKIFRAGGKKNKHTHIYICTFTNPLQKNNKKIPRD